MKITIFLVVLAMQLTAHAESLQEKNKRLVTEFYDMAFNRHEPIKAAHIFLAENYKQHNPRVADGRKGFIEAFSADSSGGVSTTEFKRFISENDLVMVHSHAKQSPQDRGVAVVDIFRVNGEMITEHWDVGQKVSETSKNDNTMF